MFTGTMMKNKFIHPATPPALVKAFTRAGSYHKLADELGVNVKYVYELMNAGIEPTDRTAKSREIRHRLKLRKHKPKNKPKPPPARKELIWWNNLGKAGRHSRIIRLYERERFTDIAELAAQLEALAPRITSPHATLRRVRLIYEVTSYKHKFLVQLDWSDNWHQLAYIDHITYPEFLLQQIERGRQLYDQKHQP